MSLRTNIVAKIGVAVALCLLIAGLALSQVQSTRVSDADWQCQDESGKRISDHQRFDTAFVACLNAPNGAYVQGGRYRINKGQPTPPAPPSPVDTDNDGVPDSADKCPTVPAATADGCPPPPTTATWEFCSREWLYCKFDGTRRVRFGLGDSWVERDLTAPPGGIECWRGSFGGVDPVPTAAKQCELRVDATTPTPDPPPAATGQATLSWVAPTQNDDGSALTDLAGYWLSYGMSPTALVHTVHVAAAVNRYTISEIAPGTYYFAVRAFTSGGRDSDSSNVVSKVVL
jgi:hypothetical protein